MCLRSSALSSSASSRSLKSSVALPAGGSSLTGPRARGSGLFVNPLFARVRFCADYPVWEFPILQLETHLFHAVKVQPLGYLFA